MAPHNLRQDDLEKLIYKYHDAGPVPVKIQQQNFEYLVEKYNYRGSNIGMIRTEMKETKEHFIVKDIGSDFIQH